MQIYKRKPIIGSWLYKYFGIETPAYKKYWKEICTKTQLDLNNQLKNKHYTELYS